MTDIELAMILLGEEGRKKLKAYVLFYMQEEERRKQQEEQKQQEKIDTRDS